MPRSGAPTASLSRYVSFSSAWIRLKGALKYTFPSRSQIVLKRAEARDPAASNCIVPANPNAFRKFDAAVPERQNEWRGSKAASPEGTNEYALSELGFDRPFGTSLPACKNPALKRWAIVGCPSEAGWPEFPKGITANPNWLETAKSL
jgi:hypothetical protein